MIFRLYIADKFLDFPFFLYYFIYLFCFLCFFFSRLISIFYLEVYPTSSNPILNKASFISKRNLDKVEPLRNQGFCYIEILFHIFYYYWDKENRSLYRGLRYVEVPYIDDCFIKWFIISRFHCITKPL